MSNAVGPDPSAPWFSVIIPTHDRLDVLPEVLSALGDQQGAPPFEVVVVDDGSTDGTGPWLDARAEPSGWRVFHQPAFGPAAARNRGVRESRGRWLAFLGDDTVPQPGWLAAHRERQEDAWAREAREQGKEVGVIGYTDWHPRMRQNPFLRYINDYGLQFGYALIDDPSDVPFNFLYTSNLSLPRHLLLEESFDQGFPYPAWEDVELSYRLKKRGFRLLYQPEARVLHDHPTDLRRFASRQEKAGYCATVFCRSHPELGSFLGIGEDGPPPLPNRFMQWCYERLARSLLWVPVRVPGLWERILRYHYICGLRRGWDERSTASQESG